MLPTIANLRKRPKHIRNRYAFFGAASFTMVVAVIWAIGTAAGIEGMVHGSTARMDEQASVARGLFTQLRDTFGAAVGGALPNQAHYVAATATAPLPQAAVTSSTWTDQGRIVIGTTTILSGGDPSEATTSAATATVPTAIQNVLQ